MPRVRRTASGAQAAHPAYFESPAKTARIPLNDDDEEKAQRLQSRKALQSRQLDQLKAAASPARKQRRSISGGHGPDTPTASQDNNAALGMVRGDAVTPMKRVPILANFEEWMKMATDNKINAANSWNFALIDYFHDMSLLREGDGVNFQKASCTLDGCVKIYTSRVDSVATETGKLLSGLADSGGRKRRGGGDEEEEGEEGEEEDGGSKKARKKAQRSAEATLASSFEQLRLKKMELEFSVDPLFKKASADFDEGGAKGLLLNHLSIDGTGRIVFDSSDDAQDASAEDSRRDSMLQDDGDAGKGKAEQEQQLPQDGPVDIAGLAAHFFPDLSKLDDQDICPSLKTFELGDGGSLELPFLKAPDNWRDDHPEVSDNNNNNNNNDAADAIAGADDGPMFGGDNEDDDIAGGADFDIPPSTGFGEGGEAWARDIAHIAPQMRVYSSQEADVPNEDGGEVGTFDTMESKAYGVTLLPRGGDEQENILNYFDTALRRNWAGPEHWKIARIRDIAARAGSGEAREKRVRKEKEPFEIDFAAPMSAELAAMLYTSASSNAQISLPKSQWRSRTRNLLPDDKHFNSKDLLKLFLKPKARMGARRPGQGTTRKEVPVEGDVDEAYWATANNAADGARDAVHPMDDDAPLPQGDYDAGFFQDDQLPLPGTDHGDDDMEFADAREAFSPGLDGAEGVGAGPVGPGIDGVVGSQPGGFGDNLVTQSRRLRPEYVQYARVATKVDVRRLKEEMWRGIGFEEAAQPPPATPAQRPPIPPLAKDDTGSLKFTAIMNNLQHVYPRQQMADISTSYCFICLLHLANEKGLVIENEEGWQDLSVRRDFSAELVEGAH